MTSIPAGIFRYNTKVTDFRGCFSDSSITQIPVDLFRYNTLFTYAQHCFYSSGITSIPSNIFKYNLNIVDYSYCFFNCTKITGPTPSADYKLWLRAGKAGYPSTITGTSCFGLCTGLSDYADIPAGWK